MFNQPNQRAVGVMVPQGQLSPGTGVPKTVSHCMKAETYAIRYADDAGNVHDSFVMQVGASWYMVPNGENFAATLKQVSETSWLGRLLTEFTKKSEVVIPKSDTVDVVG